MKFEEIEIPPYEELVKLEAKHKLAVLMSQNDRFPRPKGVCEKCWKAFKKGPESDGSWWGLFAPCGCAEIIFDSL